MSMYPKPEQLLSLENSESSSDQPLPEGGASMKSFGKCLSGNTDISSGVALGDIIAQRISSLIEDCIRQVTSSKDLSGIKGSSDGMSDRLQHCEKRASLHKDVLEAEREAVHQAACEVINALNDVHHIGQQFPADVPQ